MDSQEGASPEKLLLWVPKLFPLCNGKKHQYRRQEKRQMGLVTKTLPSSQTLTRELRIIR